MTAKPYVYEYRIRRVRRTEYASFSEMGALK